MHIVSALSSETADWIHRGLGVTNSPTRNVLSLSGSPYVGSLLIFELLPCRSSTARRRPCSARRNPTHHTHLFGVKSVGPGSSITWIGVHPPSVLMDSPSATYDWVVADYHWGAVRAAVSPLMSPFARAKLHSPCSLHATLQRPPYFRLFMSKIK